MDRAGGAGRGGVVERMKRGHAVCTPWRRVLPKEELAGVRGIR